MSLIQNQVPGLLGGPIFPPGSHTDSLSMSDVSPHGFEKGPGN